MFFHQNSQFNTVVAGSYSWSQQINRAPSSRFSNFETTKIRSPHPVEGQTIKYLENQPHISTEENLREDMIYPATQFFNCHNKLSKGLYGLIIQNSGSQSSPSNFYDPISNIISEYDQNLTHLPDNILNVFFDYTDLLEGILLVSKRRHIDITDIKDVLLELGDCYSKIYSLMTSRENGDISSITEEISRIKEEVGNRNLLPSDEEYDAEISEITSTMNIKEKEELTRLRSED